MHTNMKNKNIVIIDGCRTPFLRAGTDYKDLMSYQLGAFAIRGLLNKTGLDAQHVDSVVYGTVIANVKTSNVAREAALVAGLHPSTPCHTVTLACISANRAIASGIEQIISGQAQVVIAGGVDCVSDSPILFNKPMRKKLMSAQKLKGTGAILRFILSLRPKDFVPEAPAIAEYITNRIMGYDCELLASKFKVTREEQDEYAVRSHQLAAKAHEEGLLNDEIVKVELPPDFKPITFDNGVRGDTTLDKVRTLQPAFIKKYGTITAASSSFLTDGATALLITTEERAQQLGLKPKARVVDYAFSGQDLFEELLLGPAYATAKVLKKTGLTLEQMDVIEFHEAFAGQILSNIKALASETFCREKLGWDRAVGQVDMKKFNLWGGSLSLGHPFGATGARLATTAANRLIKEGGKYALLAACAAGAHGHAMILERYAA
ncbi:MAG: acetyl-CoA acetyltransferase [Chitinophagales bacterium]|nr:MAG: acetyl-CoA acetyltransferase [Chitinophagales bacterium]